MELEDIKKHYQNMSDYSLQKITLELDQLDIKVIPVLQEELLNRNMNKEIIVVTEFLAEGRSKVLSKDEIQDYIYEKIQSGESFENVQLELKDQGIDIIHLGAADDEELVKKVGVYITELMKKSDSTEFEKIKLITRGVFNLTEKELEVILSQLAARGSRNIKVGNYMTLIGLVLTYLGLSIGGIPGVGLVFLTVFGVWRSLEGSKQVKASKI